MDETYDVVVVGAGLAGLTAAATAAGAGSSVLVIDRSGSEPRTADRDATWTGGAAAAVPSDGTDPDPAAATISDSGAAVRGGRAATDQFGRFRFNRGGHALYRTTPGRAVLRRLGVQVTGHPPPTRGAQARLGDRVGLLPVDARSLARTSLLGRRDKVRGARLLAGVGRWRSDELAGLTAVEWLDQLGLDGPLRQLTEALIRLTSYVADTDVVSADLAAVQIQAALAGSVDYLDRGWVELVDGLTAAARQRGARLEAGARVQAVVPGGDGSHIELADRWVVARRLVLAVGTPEAAAALLPETPRSWRRLGPPSRTACLDLGLASLLETSFLLGLDQPLYLSRHAPPGQLAPPAGALYHAMLYQRRNDDPSPHDARTILGEHCRVAGIEPDQAEESRYLHRMVTCGALPTPDSGGMRGRPGVETGIDGVLAAGDWVGPAGHLADAALVSGEAAGRAAVTGLARQPTVHPVGGR
jgi:phytoene dehydrogenase-like protein